MARLPGGRGISASRRIWGPFQNPNLNIEVSFPIRIGDWWDYPWRETWPTLVEMVERIGQPTGSCGARTCRSRTGSAPTDRVARILQKYLDFLGPEDLRMILSGTAARLLGIPTS